MSENERMKRYIARTRMDERTMRRYMDVYTMPRDMDWSDWYGACYLLLEYGKAKGWRAAMVWQKEQARRNDGAVAKVMERVRMLAEREYAAGYAAGKGGTV